MKINKTLLISILILAAAVTRLLPHPVNFGPMGAIALFAGASFASRRTALLVILSAAVFSDLLVNAVIYDHFSLSYFYSAGTLSIYACYVFFGAMGMGIKTPAVKSVGGRAVLTSLIFFVVTNFMVWIGSGMYSADFSGLMASYIFALPFYHYSLAGDLVYSAVLFGSFAYLKQVQPAWLQR